MATACQTQFVNDNDHDSSSHDNTTTVISLLISYIALGYSAFSSGSSAIYTQLPTTSSSEPNLPISENNNELSESYPFMRRLQNALITQPDDEDEVVAYNYTFFHIVFAMASFYILMVVSNWSAVHISDAISSQPTVSVDGMIGVVWVKMTTSWICAGLFLWSMVAPLVVPDRQFT